MLNMSIPHHKSTQNILFSQCFFTLVFSIFADIPLPLLHILNLSSTPLLFYY